MAFSALAQVGKSAAGGTIRGTVKSGQTAVPGVAVSAVGTDRKVTVQASTGLDGSYVIQIPAPGKYVVTVALAEFVSESREVTITDLSKPAEVGFDLKVLPPPQGQARAAFRPQQADEIADTNAGPDLSAGLNEASPTTEADASAPPAGMALPGMSTDAPTEAVAVAGNTATPSFNGMFDPQRLADFQNGPPGAVGRGPGGFAGGGGGGGGGRGGGGGGGPFVIGGQRGRTNPNRPTINLSYTLGDSALNAAPYSLTGQPLEKPEYVQNRYSATISGPLVIPHIVNSSLRDNYTFSYVGGRSSNPYTAFSNVPTLLERSGDFSQTVVHGGTLAGTPVQIFDPSTGQPFANEQIPMSMIDPAASGLLAYIPEPNLPGATQNFRYITATTSDTDSYDIRWNHTFGPIAPRGQRGQRGQRGGGGGRGGGRGGRGGPSGGRGTLSVQFHYQTRDSAQVNPFPSIAGSSTGRSFDIPVSYARSFGRVSNNLRVEFSRNRNTTANLYAYNDDIAGALGITGVSENPFDWGLPGLSFTNYSGLNDIHPSLHINQTTTLTDTMLWIHGRHAIRWGGDYRWLELNTHTDSNGRGTFTFTGAATSLASQAGTGYDFADFLLGLPQLTSVQFGTSSYQFRGNSSDAFVQDDWRAMSHLTLNLGLRYEYWSPYREIHNQIANLDVAPGFSAVIPVQPGQTGPYGGTYPAGLINPDRNNFAPRIGIAWRATEKIVVRAGYGINYTTGAYAAIVQQFAFQPPFSVTETNIASASLPLTLENGFPAPPPSTITNNYGVDKNYRDGYAQMWNVNIQRELPGLIAMNVDYTGTKGTHQDVVEAPDRTATGLLIPDAQPFQWETSVANSTTNLGSVLLRRRLHNGISIGGSYVFQKSIDNASTIGGAAGNVVAQNPFNLAAERGISTFNIPHKFTGDFLWELPYGQNRFWGSGDGILPRAFGDWQLNGTWTLASGTPYTARVLGSTSDIERGTNGTLRADATGAQVSLAHPTIAEWFNTAAFSLPPDGAFGSAGRNTIQGPGTTQFNMSLNKAFRSKDTHNLDVRLQANNVFNHPQFGSIDSTVNSPTFGRVISMQSMRTVQFVARFRF